MNKATKSLLNISAILAIILGIISFFVPVLLWWFMIIGLGILCWVIGIFWEKRTLWIVAIILSLVSLLISPTFWLAIIGNSASSGQVKTETSSNVQSSRNEEPITSKNNEAQKDTLTDEKECPENYDNNSIKIPEWAKTINDAMNLIARVNMPKFEDFCSISNAWSPYLDMDEKDDKYNFQKFSDEQYTEALTMAEKKLKSIISYRNFLERAYKELPQIFPNATSTEIGYTKLVLDANLNAIKYQSDTLWILKDRNNMYIKYRNDLSKKQWRVYSDFQLLNKQYYDAFKMQSTQWTNVMFYNWNN